MVAHIMVFVYLLGLSRSPFPVAIENLEHVHDLKKAIWNEYQNDLRNVVDPHHVILYKVSLPNDETLIQSAFRALDQKLLVTAMLSEVFPTEPPDGMVSIIADINIRE